MKKMIVTGLVGGLMALMACGASGAPAGGGGPVTLTRDAAIGAKYAAPGPRSCSPRNAPVSGPPSPAQATAYVICDREHEDASDTLYLQSNVRIQVGAGRPYQYIDQAGDIDVRKTVYPIRGSLDQYLCHKIYPGMPVGDRHHAGTNCTLYRMTNMEGRCYQTTFGDWKCPFGGGTDAGTVRDRAPPSD